MHSAGRIPLPSNRSAKLGSGLPADRINPGRRLLHHDNWTLAAQGAHKRRPWKSQYMGRAGTRQPGDTGGRA